MSAVQGVQEYRTILDFSNNTLTKNYVKQAICKAEVLEMYQLQDTIIFVENDITVGMYKIRLSFSAIDAENNRNKLKDYGTFKVKIFEHKNKTDKEIFLTRDKRFNQENWIKNNTDYKLSIKNLVDVVFLCQRLNNLKMFL